MSDITPTFKVCICGDVGVGRKTFMNQFTESQMGSHPAPGLENTVLIYPLTLETSLGPVKFNCWVYIGNDSFVVEDITTSEVPPIQDDFFIGANAAFLFFDITSRASYKNIPTHFKNVVRVCDNIPVCLVGTKNDAFDERKIKPKMITYQRKKNLHYHDISSKSHYNILKPFLTTLRQLTGCHELEILQTPNNMVQPMFDSESEPLASQYKELEMQLEAISAPPLPESDEDF
jgi:GTP-binding nuclear protein Ran